MEVTIVSSREFNQDTSAAKKAARNGPVFITDHGRPAHVLLTIEQYEVMTAAARNITELLGMPGAAEVAFDPPAAASLYRPADFS
jgi:prevent-host-death family protein